MGKQIQSITDLIPDAANANKGTERGRYAVEASLRETGAGRSIVVDKDGRIIAGNKTLEAWADISGEIEIVKTDGKKLIVVQREDLDLSDVEGLARKLAYFDNRSSELGLSWNAEQLFSDLSAGVDLSGMFFDDEIADILATIDGYEKETAGEDPGADVSKADELQAVWNVQLGDLWQLGDHRLICGDCTDEATVARVMAGGKADIAFTSPPYNAGVSAKLRGNTSIGDNFYKDGYDDNQTQSDYFGLLKSFSDLALQHSKYVFVNIQFLAGNKTAFVDYLAHCRNVLADIAIWDKKHAAPQQAQRVMDSRFEFVIVLSHDATRAIGTRDFRGMVHNVYEGSPQRNNEFADSHGATFPVDLPAHFIETFTNKSDAVFEPFSGTGTTIIACEQLGRKCRAVELHPPYVSVALERFFTMTGVKPVLLERI